MYLEALGWLQESPLGAWARSGGWAYAATNSLHVLGAALVLGSIAVFDVLVLSRRGADAVGAARAAVPLAAFGLLLQLGTGFVLLAADARATGVNPAFLAKVALIALGLLNVAAIHLRFGAAWRGGFPAHDVRLYGLASLAIWTLVLLAGRLIAYV
ncbi:hypothetical protein [uncultured Enterovirga sp.]|uniref:hypothetical protein n=1 Tax=uncultured Enterovirga sp. TaxID=2026352 RepID=UPI0035CC60EF